MSFWRLESVDRILARAFASSPKFLLDWLSSKFFNDAVDMGLTDTLAGTIDVAIRAMNGAGPIAALFDSPSTDVTRIAVTLNSPTLEESQAATVLNNASLRISRAAVILNNTALSLSKVASILNNTNISLSRIVSIFKDPNITSDRVQAILYAMVDQGFFDRLVNLFTFDRTDATYSASTTLTTGVNILRNVSVASGVTLTLGASPCVLVANTLTNSGTITTNVVKGVGGAPSAGPGAGGDGRHGIVILARSVTVGTVTANGGGGGGYGSVRAFVPGNPGGAGLFWEISGYPAGTGGDGGGTGGGSGSINAGGGGGGNFPGGSGGSATVVSFPTASALLTELFKAVADYWMVTFLGRTPTTTKSIPALGGSGGGSGGAQSGSPNAGSAGGGGGGQVIVYGTSVTAGTIQANAGNGGYAGTTSWGGGGGGGGIIYVFYRSLTGTFTFSVSGGTGGGGGSPGSPGTAGSAAAFAV